MEIPRFTKEEYELTKNEDNNNVIAAEDEVFTLDDIIWENPAYNLATMPTPVYNMAYKHAERITEIEVIDQNNIKVKKSIKSCFKNDCTPLLTNLFITGDIEKRQNNSFVQMNTKFIRCDKIGSECKFQEYCPIRMGAYLYWCIKTKGLDYVKEQRDIYEKNRFKYYSEYMPELLWDKGVFHEIPLPTKDLEVADFLTEQGICLLNNRLEVENGNQVLKIIIPGWAIKYPLATLKKVFENNTITDSTTKQFVISPDFVACPWNRYGQKAYTYNVIAYVDYLKRTGRYEEYYDFCKSEELARVVNCEGILTNTQVSILNNTEAKSMYCAVIGENSEKIKATIRLLQENYLINNPNIDGYLQLTMEQVTTALTEFEPKSQTFSYKDFIPTTLHLISDIEEFLLDYKENNVYRKKSCNHLINELTNYEHGKFIILTGTKKEISRLFALDRRLKYLFEDLTIICEDDDTETIFNTYYNLLNENVKSKISNTENFKERFFNYYIDNKSFLPFKNTELSKYLAEYSNKHAFPKFPEELTKNNSLLLGDIVGLKKVKEQLSDFDAYINYIEKAKGFGKDIPRGNMHMMFLGNPGTGKTTIARVIAKRLYDIGVIKENKIIEVSRKDLIAEYIGQTAPKTQKIIDSALGGILFIDEAYSLAPPDNQRDYGQEAISTIIKAMEDNREDLIVIFAGYEKEMQYFIEANSGIVSRIGYTFNFENYSLDELVEIFNLKANKSNLKISENADLEVRKTIRYFMNIENFGNGRFVDKLFQSSIIKHARNYSNNPEYRIDIIEDKDIPTIAEVIETMPNSKVIAADKISKEDIERVAYHEVGHALVHYLLNKDTNIEIITTFAEGSGALGYVKHKKNDSQYLYSETWCKNRLKTLFGGMCAEKIIYGDHSSGCKSDFDSIKKLANNMVTKYNMTEIDVIFKEADELVSDILKEAQKGTQTLLENNIELLKALTAELVIKRQMTGDEFVAFIKKYT